MNEMSVADVLRGAIDVLAERGWYQGATTGPDGSVCAWGAICAASGLLRGGENYERLDTLPLAADAVNRLLAVTGETVKVGDWNDHPSRTYEDVVLAMKHAAVAAEAVL